MSEHDPWRMKEWESLPPGCAIDGCEERTGHDERGPLHTGDGAIHRLCPDHWEAIFLVTGRQGEWEADAHRSQPDD